MECKRQIEVEQSFQCNVTSITTIYAETHISMYMHTHTKISQNAYILFQITNTFVIERMSILNSIVYFKEPGRYSTFCYCAIMHD